VFSGNSIEDSSSDEDGEDYIGGLLVPLNTAGSRELKSLLGASYFPYPKSTQLIRALLSQVDSDALILDFFAGSGTTGHAVLDQNLKDGGTRKFLLVQLPEEIDGDSVGAAVGFKTVADITAARLTAAGEIITTNHPLLPIDCGFRKLKLDSSNFAVWDANAIEGDESKLEQQLFAQVEHVLHGRTNQDILFELMLKSRYELTTPVEQAKVGKCEVWKVAGGELVAIIDSGLTIEVIREVANWKPVSVVILDRCFGADDSLKANARKIFEDSKVDLKTV
jgi:adenine-specific DNA-methyltransferase